MVNGKMSAIDAPITRTDKLQTLLFGVLFFGIAARFWNQFSESRLWLDELFSVAVAESPPLDVVLATLRFDTHPPLYYLQLHLWSLFNQSDFWYLLNSTLWSLFSVWIMYRTVKSIYGQHTGLWAAAIFAVLPLELFFAENVRMYAFVAVLEILLWGVLEGQIRARWRHINSYILAALLAAAITLTHGLGFLVVFFCFLQAGIRELTARGLRGLLPLVLSVVPAVLCSVWPLAIGSFRQTEGLPGFDLYSIGVHLTLTLLGMDFPMPELTGFIAFVIVVALCLRTRQSAMQISWLVVLPFALLLLLSLFVKPVFIYRTLGLFLPFLAIAMAVAAGRVFDGEGMISRLTVGGVLAVMMANGVNYSLHFEKNGYRAVVDQWEQTASSDALIVAETPVDFWALQRYLAEGVRFSALDVQPPVADGMMALKQRLDGTPLEQLGFFGRAKQRQIAGHTLTFAPQPDMLKDDVIWVINPKAGCSALEPLLGEGQRFTLSESIAAQGQSIQACRLEQ